jgi:hypothetical protein
LLVVKPFKENLGSLVLGGKLASFILQKKRIQDAQVQPFNLHQKLVCFFLNQNLHVRQGKRDYISSETGDV